MLDETTAGPWPTRGRSTAMAAIAVAAVIACGPAAAGAQQPGTTGPTGPSGTSGVTAVSSTTTDAATTPAPAQPVPPPPTVVVPAPVGPAGPAGPAALLPDGPVVALDASVVRSRRCDPGRCSALVEYTPPTGHSVELAADFDHEGAPETGFVPDASVRCSATTAYPGRCFLRSPDYATEGVKTVALRGVFADGTTLFQAATVLVEVKRTYANGGRLTVAERARQAGCPPEAPGVHCGPGNGRRTAGGGEKASHKGWPAITGILWYVLEVNRSASVKGTPRNDELLGFDGDDVLRGEAGKDVIWGNSHPSPNTTRQVDRLYGGAGNDFIYAGHGKNTIDAGPGNDRVFGHFGHGRVDCGPGRDYVEFRFSVKNYRTKDCEVVRNG